MFPDDSGLGVGGIFSGEWMGRERGIAPGMLGAFSENAPGMLGAFPQRAVAALVAFNFLASEPTIQG
jgi:hypothetical protein